MPFPFQRNLHQANNIQPPFHDLFLIITFLIEASATQPDCLVLQFLVALPLMVRLPRLVCFLLPTIPDHLSKVLNLTSMFQTDYLQLQQSIPISPANRLLVKEAPFLLVLLMCHHKHSHIRAIWLPLHKLSPVFSDRYTVETVVLYFHFLTIPHLILQPYTLSQPLPLVSDKMDISHETAKNVHVPAPGIQRSPASKTAPSSINSSISFSPEVSYPFFLPVHFHPHGKIPYVTLPIIAAELPYPALAYHRSDQDTHAHGSTPQ